MLRAFVVAAASAALLPSVAVADSHPMDVTAITPAPGAIAALNIPSYGIGSQAFELTIPSRPAIYSLKAEVATANVPGQDGTLADDYAVPGSYGFFTARDSNPSVYTGSIDSPVWSKPGTYYVQFSTTGYGYPACPAPGESSCTYMSPVYTYTVTAPTPTPAPAAPTTSVPAPVPAPSRTPPSAGSDEVLDFNMSRTQAQRHVREAIRAETQRTAHNLKYGCKRSHYDEFVCSSSWYDAKNVWAVDIDVLDMGDSINYSGTGLKASRACLKRHSVKRCATKIAW